MTESTAFIKEFEEPTENGQSNTSFYAYSETKNMYNYVNDFGYVIREAKLRPEYKTATIIDEDSGDILVVLHVRVATEKADEMRAILNREIKGEE